MKRYLLPLLLLFVWVLSADPSAAQQRCASYEYLVQQLQEHPDFLQYYRTTNRNFDDYISPRKDGINGRPAQVTIPVVVHVVYNTAQENISDAQINSQITVLNEDFTALNADYNNYNAGYGSVRGDANIQFCVVLIKRVYTRTKSFSTNDNVKKTNRGGSDPVDPTRYLNIWVCDLGQGLLGYAQFPGGPLATDGVVVDYQAFGKGSGFNLYPAYNKGRTATHEIGHWLGLRHIWGDATCGNDFVDDTPLHNAANYGCPAQGHLSTCTGTPLEMWMNYMDYTDDACMYFFSAGQVSRMDYFLDNNARLAGIVANASCSPISGVSSGGNSGPGNGNGNGNPGNSRLMPGDFAVYPTVSDGRNIQIEINALNHGTAQLNVYNQAGALVYKNNLAVSQGFNYRTFNLDKLANGVYMIQMVLNGEVNVKKLIIQQ